jgi:hypothetical protein
LGLLVVVTLSYGAVAGERKLILVQQSGTDRQACFAQCQATSIACANDCENQLGGGLPGTTRKESELIQCRIACNVTYGACSRACN